MPCVTRARYRDLYLPTAYLLRAATSVCVWAVILMLTTRYFLAVTGVQEEESAINILALLSFKIPNTTEQPLYTDGPVILPAVQLAVDQVNNRRDVLSGYTLNLTVVNSACNLMEESLLNFIPAFFHNSSRFAGIVGPTCSDSAELLSFITSEVATLNFHIAGSHRLANRSKYGFSFGTVGSGIGDVELLLSLVRYNNWRTIGLFYEESKVAYEVSYALFIEKFRQQFPERNIKLSAPISEYYLPVSSIDEHRVRVVFIISSSELMRRMFCLISQSFPHLKFPTYQFVLFEVGSSSFHRSVKFAYDGQQFSCSARQLTASLEGTLLMSTLLEVEEDLTLVSGVSYSEYIEQYQAVLDGARVNESTLDWANPVYDGVWALALALNRSLPKLNEIGLDLSNYRYGQLEASEIIRNEVYKLEFQGASGRIAFDSASGYVNVTVGLHQILANRSIPVGNFSQDIGQPVFTTEAQFIESDFETFELLVDPALATFSLLLTLLALVLIITAHTLSIVHRNFESVKASSYRLSQLVYIGCYVLVISIVVLSVEKVSPKTSVNKPALCTIQVWCLPISLTLILGSIAVKTWRLYRIFIQFKSPGKCWHDYGLITMVLVLVAVDAVLCFCWTVTSPLSISQREQLNSVNKIEVTVECHSDGYFAWFGVLLSLQAILLVTALIFALLTKTIRHKSFKTKTVVLLVYFLTLTLLLGFPTYFVLKVTSISGPNANYTTLSLTLVTVLYLCLGLQFFPPVWSLLQAKLFPRLPGLRELSTSTVQPKSFLPSLQTTLYK